MGKDDDFNLVYRHVQPLEIAAPVCMQVTIPLSIKGLFCLGVSSYFYIWKRGKAFV
jgi:hypothetical protein